MSVTALRRESGLWAAWGEREVNEGRKAEIDGHDSQRQA